ncbi:hypothetical protein L873DRAFT_192105 [Choiromyces venosus 120613-1]|uniref:Uncharacterized protein n=1 Tax=Choiromyces venosus 120613-1 TaxID=1336337 RepID=A0A3N4J707_9PEZI|nr:hypothetical protein L873DRAFT_192105 [Choiromyces venosus 120613-1]
MSDRYLHFQPLYFPQPPAVPPLSLDHLPPCPKSSQPSISFLFLLLLFSNYHTTLEMEEINSEEFEGYYYACCGGGYCTCGKLRQAWTLTALITSRRCRRCSWSSIYSPFRP